MKTLLQKIADSLFNTWTIATKDILDSLKNKLIVSMILGMGFMLLMPNLLGLVFVDTATPVIVFDPNESTLLNELNSSDQFSVRRAKSIEEFQETIGSMGLGLGVDFGLAIPEDFDAIMESDGELEIEGFTAWSNRFKAPTMKSEFESQIEILLNKHVSINIAGNRVFPPSESSLMIGLSTMTSVTVILIMGIQLVPSLIFDEKQTKTLDALLVSPASIGQVVMGKALAGFFYMFVAATIVFALNWTGVVHWEMAFLFTISSGFFAVAVGLILGSFFERQQDVGGISMLTIFFLIGTIFVDLVGMDVPLFVETLLPWVPSVVLVDIIQLAFLEEAAFSEILVKLSSLIGISLILYLIVVWKVRRTDR